MFTVTVRKKNRRNLIGYIHLNNIAWLIDSFGYLGVIHYRHLLTSAFVPGRFRRRTAELPSAIFIFIAAI